MKVLIVFVILFLGYSPIQGQTYSIQKPLVSRNHKPYFVKDKFYNFEELGFLFQQDQELSRLHRASIKNNTVGKVFGYTTLGLWGAGVIAFVSDNSHTEGLLNAGQGFGLVLIVLVSPITGTIGLIANQNGKFIQNKAVRAYNRFYKDKFGRDIEYPKLGLTKSGMGISISF